MAVSGIDVKMAVTGISQFKNNISQAKQNMKTLDAQLTLTEKQFKATGDAETYMQLKSEQLKAKLAEQKTVAENAEKALRQMTEQGVDKGSKAFQDMIRTLASAKGDMIDTQTALDNIAGAADDADAAIGDLDTGLKQIGQGISIQNVTNALDKITGGMEAAMKKAWELGKAITREVLGAGSWADDLNTRAAYFEMSPEELQRIEKTASLIDTSVDSIVGAKNRMEKNLSTGSDSTIEALKNLGLSEIVSTNAEDQFWEIGEAIMKMGDAYTQEEAAQALFGKSWHELIPLFQAGREEYEKLNASWNVVPKEQIDALQQMDDQYQILKKDLETVKLTFLGELAPAAEGVMKTLTGLVEKFNEYIQSENGQQMMESLSQAVSSLFEDLANIDPDDVANTITGILDSIKDALNWIKENKDAVVTAVEAFIAAWAGLEFAKGVTIALQLINGVKGVFGKGTPVTGNGTGGGTGTGGVVAGSALSSWGEKLAPAASKAGIALSGVGPFAFGAIGDMFLNQTNTGRALRDGGDVLEGLKQDLEETGEQLQENYEHFGENWDPDNPNANVLAKIAGQTGKNLEAAGEWTLGDEYSIEDIQRMMEEAAKAQEESAKNNKDTTDSTKTVMKKLEDFPDEVKKSFLESIGGMKVVMDGKIVGEITLPYISDGLASGVFGFDQ